MIDIGFEWKRAHDYECVSARGRKWLRAIGKGRDTLEPLKIETEKPLYLRFADLDGSEESCLRFARAWGLLTTESPTGEEMLETWQELIQAMRKTMVRLGVVEESPPSIPPKRGSAKVWKIASLDVLLVGGGPSSSEASRPMMLLQPRHLLEAMHLQLGISVAVGGSVRACKQCGGWFERGATESRRSIAVFCSEKCKNRFHYLERAKR
jgi:hypothetical protein